MHLKEISEATNAEEKMTSNGSAAEEVFVFPPTAAQRRFWMLDQLKPGNPALNFALSARLQGRVDLAALERTINEILRRHEVLRTTFRTVDGEVVQIIHPEKTTRLDLHDVTGLQDSEREAQVEKLRLEEAVRPFSLLDGPLLRAGLIKVKEDNYVLNLSMHHIACDGWSNGVLIPELAKIYSAFLTGHPSLPELPLQYADFAQWQNDWLTSSHAAVERDYWRNQLRGVLPTLNLPTDRPRRAGRTHPGTIHSLLLPKTLMDPLKEMCLREDITLFMMILAAYGLILYRYTGNPDVVIGSPAANRTQPDLEGLIGLFTNPLLMRLNFSDNPTMRMLLARVKSTSLDAFAHQSYPFEKLAEELQTDPNRSGVQWLQAYFVFQKAFMLPQQMPGLTLTPMRSVSCGAMFEWLLGVVERAEGVRLQLEYNTDLYDYATIDRMLHHFQRVLETALANPDTRIDQMQILCPAESQNLIVDWNAVGSSIQPDQRCHKLFEQQVQKAPDAPAVCDSKTQLSYSELNGNANRLAHYLRSLGLKPNDRVGLAVDSSSTDFVTGFLGVLKAGGCCVFLDRCKGAEALARPLKESRLDFLLTESGLPASLIPAGIRVVCFDTDAAVLGRQPGSDIADAFHKKGDACIRFSAGRVGSSKGWIFSHDALVNGAVVAAGELGIGSQDRVAGEIDEIMPALLTGAMLVLPDRPPRFETLAWLDWAKQHQITVAALPTQCWHQLVRGLSDGEDSPTPSLRLIAVGGDPISPAAIAAWQRLSSGRIRLLDRYFLTETNGAAAYSDPFSSKEELGRVAIIRPAPGVQIYLLDANLQPVPVGVPGDVYVAGKRLSSGSVGGADPGSEAFVSATIPGQPDLKLLKTGDRGRFLAGGGIELVGRADDLAKTNSFRLELCEMRWQIFQYPGVWDALVLPREEAGEKKLAAYVVCATQTPREGADLRGLLQQHFPAYMVPEKVFILQEFPLTLDGRLDRTALPTEDSKPFDRVPAAPAATTATEEVLLRVWREVLGLKEVGPDDNFLDLGGGSLTAVQLQIRVEKALGRKVPLAAFFQAPTVTKLHKLLALPGIPARQIYAFQPSRQKEESPVFVIHFLFMAQLLADHLGPGRPVYGIESRLGEEVDSAEKGRKVATSLELLAKKSVEEIRLAQPHGPYNLAGFCFGGLLAFEIASQLIQQGEKVGLLALLNAYYGPGMKRTSTPWLTHQFYHLRQFSAHHWSYLSKKVGDKFSKNNNHATAPENAQDRPHATWDPKDTLLFQSNLARQVILAYRGKPLAVPTVLFRAVTDPPPIRRKYDPAYGWRDLILGDLQYEDILCGHSEIVEEPWIGEVSARLQKHLSRNGKINGAAILRQNEKS